MGKAIRIIGFMGGIAVGAFSMEGVYALDSISRGLDEQPRAIVLSYPESFKAAGTMFSEDDKAVSADREAAQFNAGLATTEPQFVLQQGNAFLQVGQEILVINAQNLQATIGDQTVQIVRVGRHVFGKTLHGQVGHIELKNGQWYLNTQDQKAQILTQMNTMRPHPNPMWDFSEKLVVDFRIIQGENPSADTYVLGLRVKDAAGKTRFVPFTQRKGAFFYQDQEGHEYRVVPRPVNYQSNPMLNLERGLKIYHMRVNDAGDIILSSDVVTILDVGRVVVDFLKDVGDFLKSIWSAIFRGQALSSTPAIVTNTSAQMPEITPIAESKPEQQVSSSRTISFENQTLQMPEGCGIAQDIAKDVCFFIGNGQSMVRLKGIWHREENVFSTFYQGHIYTVVMNEKEFFLVRYAGTREDNYSIVVLKYSQSGNGWQKMTRQEITELKFCATMIRIAENKGQHPFIRNGAIKALEILAKDYMVRQEGIDALASLVFHKDVQVAFNMGGRARHTLEKLSSSSFPDISTAVDPNELNRKAARALLNRTLPEAKTEKL